jgi:hypothetical protein
MSEPSAERLYREACWRFLRACLDHRHSSMIRRLARELRAAKAAMIGEGKRHG